MQRKNSSESFSKQNIFKRPQKRTFGHQQHPRVYYIVVERVPGTRNPGFGYYSTMQKWVEGMLNKAFFLHFLPYLFDFSNWCPQKVLRNFEIHQIWQKKWRKAFFGFLSTHFTDDNRYPKIGFQVHTHYTTMYVF